jgi:hypothetical protein
MLTEVDRVIGSVQVVLHVIPPKTVEVKLGFREIVCAAKPGGTAHVPLAFNTLFDAPPPGAGTKPLVDMLKTGGGAPPPLEGLIG